MTNFAIGYLPVFLLSFVFVLFLSALYFLKEENLFFSEESFIFTSIPIIIYPVITSYFADASYIKNPFNPILVINLLLMIFFIFCALKFHNFRSLIKRNIPATIGLYVFVALMNVGHLHSKVSNEDKAELYDLIGREINTYPQTLEYLRSVNLKELRLFEMGILSFLQYQEKQKMLSLKREANDREDERIKSEKVNKSVQDFETQANFDSVKN